MAIKTTTQGTVPAVTLDRLQFSQVNITANKKPPYKISFSAIVEAYGVDQNGVHVYSGSERKIIIPDVHAFILSKTGQELVDSSTAMQKVQEGFGLLAQVYFNDVTFDQYVQG